MENNELIEIESENGIVSVNTNDIPDIISGRIEDISQFEKEVENSESSAKAAMEYVGTQMTRYEEKGKWIFKHRSGNTKDIIKDTQEAVERLASAQQVSVNALKKSFEFQKKLAETAKYLFELGCANITVNRIAVRAIEQKLNGASKEELSELARQEMLAVVRQLKEQEDILKKQEFLTSKVKKNVSRLNKKDKLDKEQSERIASLSNENKEQNKKLSGIHNSLLEKERIDAEQSQRLEELGALIENKNSIDEKQEAAITANTEAIKVLVEYTKQKDIIDKQQSEEIEVLKKSSRRKLCIVAISVSVVAIICSIVSIML
ncbi:hypothetical protein [Treponema denticola]|uniref:hypothetical protein n=1 Tax=Treponema denticola TaxID=158 RepID=UPI002104B1B4|nr:hypothetical protein [Treponema denticola]UTY23713.1 hypothetical protein E4N78_05920 [Treponema denticola]